MTQNINIKIFAYLAATLLPWLTSGLTACTNKTHDHSSRTIQPRRDGALIDGIDVSSHQGEINWVKVTANDDIRFAYIKATEGATYQSRHYSYNIRQARENGLMVGSYHYLTSSSYIRDQFKNFISLMSSEQQDLIPMIDIEERATWSRSQLIDSLSLMAELLEQHFKKKPMIYSTMDFYNQNLSPQFNKYPLYIGRYSGSKPEISWEGDYTVWQFSENGIVAGINAYVDQCRFHPNHDIVDLLLE